MKHNGSHRIANDVALVLCGEAGQGIQTVETLLAHLLKQAGYYVFATKEYMSRIRGGSNSTLLRIASHPINAYIDRIDFLIPFDGKALAHVRRRVTPNTYILGDQQNLTKEIHAEDTVIDIPFSELAQRLGNRVYINTLATGVLAGIFSVPTDHLQQEITHRFAKKKDDIIQHNLTAALQGYEKGKHLISTKKISVNISTTPEVQEKILISGSEAVGIGALAAGINFMAAYPMSPSTGVFTFLSQHTHTFDLITEQAEDEIAAINMVLGASYAGANAMVTTSGGGFALMVEGLSLSGMLELPIVIHLAQRPGPATGLPTRTEQADLFFALHAGHGEFPRAIFAPGTLEQAYTLTQRAFVLADKYQIPVFILTDQYFVDSYTTLPIFSQPLFSTKDYTVQTSQQYQRYALTSTGISPRGIPGKGDGLICVDSDEHDEDGHISENLDLRAKMVDKRLKKAGELAKETVPPDLYGDEEYLTLIIGWGSTCFTIQEALTRIHNKKIALLHFSQVYPIHPKTIDFISKAHRLIIVENNATAQFGHLLQQITACKIDDFILQYNGLPFSVETVEQQLSKLLRVN